MITASPTRPLTACEFLLDGVAGQDAAEGLARELEQRHVARASLGGLHRLSGSALRAVYGEIAAVTTRLLDLRLADALVGAWRTYSKLTSAAEGTLATPDSKAVVPLAPHRVTWTHDPHIDVLVDGTKITSLEFRMAVVFDLRGVVAVVRASDLVALRCGECLITATLTLEEETLAHRRARTHPALIIPLDPPVPLLRDPSTAAVPVRHADAARPDSQCR
jgi:hypothetical protein